MPEVDEIKKFILNNPLFGLHGFSNTAGLQFKQNEKIRLPIINLLRIKKSIFPIYEN